MCNPVFSARGLRGPPKAPACYVYASIYYTQLYTYYIIYVNLCTNRYSKHEA